MSDEQDWVSVVEDIDGFWDEDEQPRVQGKVMGISTMVLARRETMVAILMLSKPCVAVVGSGKEKVKTTLEPGQAIGVVVKHKLSSLYSMVDNHCEVAIEAREKITLDNGNTMWRYAIAHRGRRTLMAMPVPKPAAPSASGSSKSADSVDPF
jgi:hypothetical protein